jgi:PHD/YefM family antitoxin component YafN of YafNO toxin-antitoxin module
MDEGSQSPDGAELVHVSTQWYAGGDMETLKVGMREFRDKLATYLLESETPVAITRHGDTIGYFIPARRKRSDADKAALKEAAVRWQETLEAEGVSEDEIVAEFKKWRSKQKR